MHSPHTGPPAPPMLVGVLYRSTSVPEVPVTPTKRVFVLASVGVLVLALVLALVS